MNLLIQRIPLTRRPIRPPIRQPPHTMNPTQGTRRYMLHRRLPPMWRHRYMCSRRYFSISGSGAGTAIIMAATMAFAVAGAGVATDKPATTDLPVMTALKKAR
jgi:hypothetical protein